MAMQKGQFFIYPKEGRIDRLLKGGALKTNIGTPDSKGYLRVKINGKCDRIHRIIWSYVNGPIPAGMVIDHINGDKSDNRIENLRLTTCSQNSQNRTGPQKNSKTQVKGVSFVAKLNKFEAAIHCNRKKFTVGYFESIEAAEKAYCTAASKIHTHNPSANRSAAK